MGTPSAAADGSGFENHGVLDVDEISSPAAGALVDHICVSATDGSNGGALTVVAEMEARPTGAADIGYQRSTSRRLTGGVFGEPNPPLATRPDDAPPEWYCGDRHIAGGPNLPPVYPAGDIACASDGCGNNCPIRSLLQMATGRGGARGDPVLRTECGVNQAILVAKYGREPTAEFGVGVWRRPIIAELGGDPVGWNVICGKAGRPARQERSD